MKHLLHNHILNQKIKKAEPLPQPMGHPQQLPPQQQAQLPPGAPGNLVY